MYPGANESKIDRKAQSLHKRNTPDYEAAPLTLIYPLLHYVQEHLSQPFFFLLSFRLRNSLTLRIVGNGGSLSIGPTF
jgi:hypothetical protein